MYAVVFLNVRSKQFHERAGTCDEVNNQTLPSQIAFQHCHSLWMAWLSSLPPPSSSSVLILTIRTWALTDASLKVLCKPCMPTPSLPIFLCKE